MPTYVFKCSKCGFELEQLMSIREFTENPAPVCCNEGCDGHQRMKNQIQAVGFSLKGVGWTPKFAHGNAEGPPTDIAIPRKRR